jgi:hypothetical protein
MKSSSTDLERRGFLKDGAENTYTNLPNSPKVELLKSPFAVERTLGARLLSQSGNFAINDLIEALKVESKLYTKIEICSTLVKLGEVSVKPLIAELGKIGNNQHKCIPNQDFKKVSYPLPRDIAARTLAQIGKLALPDLLDLLSSNDMLKLSEAIDAIGFICFYNYQPEIGEKLITCYKSNIDNDLICWKLIRAMSGFPESKSFLLYQQSISSNEGINIEIERSLKLITGRR